MEEDHTGHVPGMVFICSHIVNFVTKNSKMKNEENRRF